MQKKKTGRVFLGCLLVILTGMPAWADDLIGDAAIGDVKAVKKLLTHGAGVNRPDKEGRLPLVVAAANGQSAVVKLLLAHGADVDRPDKTGYTPFHEAAMNGHADVVKILLAHGADVNRADKFGLTPLEEATSDNVFVQDHAGVVADVVKLLLAHGAEVNGADINGGPLQSAASNGYADVVKILLAHGADVNRTGKNGETPLQSAAFYDHPNVVKILLANGAAPILDSFPPIRGESRSLIQEALDGAPPSSFGPPVVVRTNTPPSNSSAPQANSSGPCQGVNSNDPGCSGSGASPGLSSAEAHRIASQAAQRAAEETQAEYDKKIQALQAQIHAQSQSGSSNASMQAEILALMKTFQEKKKRLPSAPVFHSSVDAPDYHMPPDSRKYAVVIGIESYQSLPKADFARRDAKDVYLHLVALGYEKRHIQYLRDGQATKSLLKAIFEDWLPKNVDPHPGSEVFVYFSGHGAPNEGTHHAYLVPWDGNPEFLKDTGFSLTRLYSDLGKLHGKVIVALDSCFSGAGGRSVLAKGARPLVTRIETPLIARSSNLTVLAAAQANQISTSDEEHGHGTFTYYLLQEMNRTKGKTTVGQLYRYVKPKVEDAARLQNGTQTPQLFGSGNGRL